jgi:hypothetical protein
MPTFFKISPGETVRHGDVVCIDDRGYLTKAVAGRQNILGAIPASAIIRSGGIVEVPDYCSSGLWPQMPHFL